MFERAVDEAFRCRATAAPDLIQDVIDFMRETGERDAKQAASGAPPA